MLGGGERGGSAPFSHRSVPKALAAPPTLTAPLPARAPAAGGGRSLNAAAAPFYPSFLRGAEAVAARAAAPLWFSALSGSGPTACLPSINFLFGREHVQGGFPWPPVPRGVCLNHARANTIPGRAGGGWVPGERGDISEGGGASVV